MKYLLNFAFLAANVALGPLIIVILSRRDVLLASEFSFVLAVVSLIFSIALLNQRNYIYIYGNKHFSYSSQFSFRVINCFVLALICYVYYFLTGKSTDILLLIVLMKFSELVLDFNHTITVGTSSSIQLLKLLILLVIPRVVIVLIAIYFFNESMIINGLLIFVLFGVVADLFVKANIKFSFTDYSKIFSPLKELGLVGLLTSVFSLAPRLVLDPKTNEVELIALSMSPVLGLAFQTVWISMSVELREYNRSKYLIYTLKILLMLALFLILYPFWKIISIFIYGFESVEDVNRFVLTIVLSAVLFSCASLCNLLKIINIRLDILSYSIALISIFILNFFEFDFIFVLSIPSLLMLTIFIYGFAGHEKNNIYKK